MSKHIAPEVRAVESPWLTEESEISLALAYAANLCEDAINVLQKTLG
ncbi:hypothetical protein ACFY1L_50065 [Streptomyces sp. NPDC001663]